MRSGALRGERLLDASPAPPNDHLREAINHQHRKDFLSSAPQPAISPRNIWEFRFDRFLLKVGGEKKGTPRTLKFTGRARRSYLMAPADR